MEGTARLYGGYGPVAEMFAWHACTVIMSGMVDAAGSGADELLAKMKDTCTKHGVRLACENTSFVVATDSTGSPGIWSGLLTADCTRLCHFAYQRMGMEFFLPEHRPLFVQFMRALEFPEEAHEDDLLANGDNAPLIAPSSSAIREAKAA